MKVWGFTTPPLLPLPNMIKIIHLNNLFFPPLHQKLEFKDFDS